MSPVPDSEYLTRVSVALVSEIKAEMGRRDLSYTGLAVLLGQHKQYVTSRLGAGNPRTGKRVEVNIMDLYAIAGALEIDVTELLDRALKQAGPVTYGDGAFDLDSPEPRSSSERTYPEVMDEAARPKSGKKKLGED